MDSWQWSCVAIGAVLIVGVFVLDWYIHHDEPPPPGPAVKLPYRKPRNGIERDRFVLASLAEKIEAAEKQWKSELNDDRHL